MKKKALGRGLEALIPESKPVESPLTEIDIDLIVPNPNQPRLSLDEERLEELAASVRMNGILQPVLVRPAGNGYQLIAGERRLAAAQRAAVDGLVPGLSPEPVTGESTSRRYQETYEVAGTQ